MKTLLVLVVLGGAIGCDSSPDRAAEACGRIWDTSCAKFVECRVTVSGTVITSQICQQSRANAVMSCVAEEGAGIMAATDAQIDACVQGFATFACANLCNQVPQDPPACQAIDPEPNVDTITCAP